MYQSVISYYVIENANKGIANKKRHSSVGWNDHFWPIFKKIRAADFLQPIYL